MLRFQINLEKEKKKKMALEMTNFEIDNKMTRTQRNLITGLIFIIIFAGSTCFSVQGPIYPDEVILTFTLDQ